MSNKSRNLGVIPLLLILMLCTLYPSVGVQGYVVSEILMCHDIDAETYEPFGIGDVFFTHSPFAVCWVNITDIYTALTVRFDFYDSNNQLYFSEPVDIESPPRDMFWIYYVAYGFISVEGFLPANSPGTWTVKIYIENALAGSTTFKIVDYEEITEEIDTLQTEVNSLETDYNQLSSDYASLQQDYQTLNTEYDALQDDYNIVESEMNALQEDYNALSSDYNVLSGDYNSLEADYESTLNDLNTTRNIMYGTSAGAVVFLIIAIYFATRKR